MHSTEFTKKYTTEIQITDKDNYAIRNDYTRRSLPRQGPRASAGAAEFCALVVEDTALASTQQM